MERSNAFLRNVTAFSCLLAALLLTGCGGSPAPEERAPQPTSLPEPAWEPLPDSLLYYGEILELQKEEDGSLLRLLMESPKDGKYGMNVGDQTLYVDSGERRGFDPDSLSVGDRVYVFHSPITARSLPPQSPAFLIVKNIPMDASCPMYHLAEKISRQDGRLEITTDHGEKLLICDENTAFINLQGQEADASLLKEGDHVLAWYFSQGETALYPSHLMLLP